jgi:putative transposase
VSLKNYKSNKNVMYSNKYHVVWCPKYRRSVLRNNIATRLEEILRDVCKQLEAEIIALEIMPDHVHLLVEVDPQFGVHRLVKRLKGTSSRLLRQEFSYLRTSLPTLWTNSVFYSTVGERSRSYAPLAVIKQYVENQKDV